VTDLDPARRNEDALCLTDGGEQFLEPVDEGGVGQSQTHQQLPPRLGADRVDVPAVNRSVGGHHDRVDGRQQLAELAGIEPAVGRQDVDPLVDPHVIAADVSDDRAVDSTDHGRHGYPRPTHRLLEGRVELGILRRDRELRMLHSEAAAFGGQLPDLTQPPEGDRAVQRGVPSQPEPLGDQMAARRIKHEPTVRGPPGRQADTAARATAASI
jgi:hypothetical protein